MERALRDDECFVNRGGSAGAICDPPDNCRLVSGKLYVSAMQVRILDAANYVWRANFWRTANGGNGAGASRSDFLVPEPISSALLILALTIAALGRRPLSSYLTMN